MAEKMPALRSALTRKLSERGMSQIKIAEMLGITQAAVSQYLSNVRGKHIMRNPETEKEISRLAQRVIDERKAPDFCELCMCNKRRY